MIFCSECGYFFCSFHAKMHETKVDNCYTTTFAKGLKCKVCEFVIENRRAKTK